MREPDPVSITIGLAAHHAYCPRRAWLEIAGEHTDTRQVAVGLDKHVRTDDPATGRSEQHRALDVVHEEWGYTGRCDTVEELPDGSLRVVEYKATPVRRTTAVTEPMRLQVTLQALALQAMGHRTAEPRVYFTEHRRRVPVPIGGDEITAARSLVERTRATVESDTAPPPLEDDPRCTRCSHAGVCLPDERDLRPVRRRIVVADPDTQVLHLATPGARASVRSGRAIVRKGDEELSSVPLERVQGVVVHGNVDLSGALIRELLWRDVPIVWCTGSGRLVGWASSTRSPNGLARARQHVSPQTRIELARQFVAAKIANQANAATTQRSSRAGAGPPSRTLPRGDSGGDDPGRLRYRG